MANMMESGAVWLKEQLFSHAATQITYTGQGYSAAISAVRAETTAELTNEFGLNIDVRSADFIVRRSDLAVSPKRGDRISLPVGDDVVTYEVLADVSEYVYRESDRFGQTLRIHTKEVERSRDFIITVDTTKAGSASDTFVLPTTGAGYDATVSWGDGESEVISGTPGDVSHTYPSSGEYSIRIRENSTGGFPRIYFNSGGDCQKLISVNQWGNGQWASMERAFSGCSNLTSVSGKTADLSGVVSASRCFLGCSGDIDLSGWAGNNIQDWSYCFSGCSGVTSLNVTGLVTQSATTLALMFYGFPQIAIALDLSSWNVSNVTTMQNFAYGSGTIPSMNITGWDTGKVQSFSQFARNNSSIVITGVDDIDTSSCTNMGYMLNLCAAQIPLLDPSGWNIGLLTNGGQAFVAGFVGMPTPVYDATLIAWEAQPHQSGVTFSFGQGSKYTSGGAAEAARTALILDGWTIQDGGPA